MRVAVITGGMGGLGDSISTKMLAAGYQVVVTHSPGTRKPRNGSPDTRPAVANSAPTRSTLRILIPARSASHELPKTSDLLTFGSTTLA